MAEPGLADPGLERTHKQILRELGLESGRLSKKESRGWHSRAAGPPGRNLAAAVKALQVQPFLVRRGAYSERELATLTKATIERIYSPLADPAIGPVHDRAERQRMHSIYWRLGAHLSRELGVPKKQLGPLLLLQGGLADGPGASSLANGSMIMYRGSLPVADAVAKALLAAGSKRELLGNLLTVALGRDPDLDVDQRHARHVADGFLAITVGHEMTHGLKKMVAEGRPRDITETPFGPSSPTFRAQETIADAGGADLAMRAMFSPVGVLAFYLYHSVREAYTGAMNGPLAGTHPRSNQRYRFVHRYMTARAGARRPIYDGVHRRRLGAPYLAPADRHALEALPTPDELDQYLLGLPHGIQYLYPRAMEPR